MEIRRSKEPSANFRGIMKGIKQSKRRFVQRTKQTVGFADAEKDDDFKTACDDFVATDKRLTDIYVKLKEAITKSQEMTDKWLALARSFVVHYSDADENDPMVKLTKDYLEATKQMSEIQAACNQLIKQRACDELYNQVSNRHFDIKKKISKDKALKTDVESYRRRLEALKAKGREESDADLIKLDTKHQRASSAYKVLHPELMNTLNQIIETKHSSVMGYFLTLVASQELIQKVHTAELAKVISTMGQTYDLDPVLSDLQRVTMDS